MTSNTATAPGSPAWRDPAVARRTRAAIDEVLGRLGVDEFLRVQDDAVHAPPWPEAVPFAPGLVATLRRAVAVAAAAGEARVAPAHLGRALRGEGVDGDAGAAVLDATAPVARLLDEATALAYADGATEVRVAHLVEAVRAATGARRELARAA